MWCPPQFLVASYATVIYTVNWANTVLRGGTEPVMVELVLIELVELVVIELLEIELIEMVELKLLNFIYELNFINPCMHSYFVSFSKHSFLDDFFLQFLTVSPVGVHVLPICNASLHVRVCMINAQEADAGCSVCASHVVLKHDYSIGHVADFHLCRSSSQL